MRPISLLCVPSKLLEFAVLKDVKTELLSHIPAHQYAYCPESNTTCALIALHDFLTKSLDESSIIGAVLISYDFSKAFDTLPHHTLLRKMRSLGFRTGFIIWLNNYLSDRKQRVKISGIGSDYLPVTSGVPQGSLIGPFLFILMCHDLSPVHPSTFMIQYADDTPHVCPIYKGENRSNIPFEEFNGISNWSSRNGFLLNASKTKCIVIKKKSFTDELLPLLPCDPETHLKLLGVIWSCELNWQTHFDFIQSKCSQKLFFIRVLKNHLSHDNLWIVFGSIIESYLLYATELFGNLSSSILQHIDRIYRRATKIICSNTCTCPQKNHFRSTRKNRTLTLLNRAQNATHPLHGIVVPSHRPNAYIMPSFNTSRGRNCFTIY